MLWISFKFLQMMSVVRQILTNDSRENDVIGKTDAISGFYANIWDMVDVGGHCLCLLAAHE